MTEQKIDDTGFCRLSIVGAAGLSMVSSRPRRIDRQTIEKLLRPDEQLISMGTLQQPVYFGFDEKMVVSVFVIYIVVCGFWTLFADKTMNPLPFLPLELTTWFLNNGMPTVFVCSTVLLALSRIRRSSYALTNERLLFFGQFLQSFELASFESAVVHRSEEGQAFLELTVLGGTSPALVMQFASQAPDAEAALMPLLPPNLRPAPTAGLKASPDNDC